MTAVYLGVSVSDGERRARLSDDDLFAYSASPATPGLCARARGIMGTVFAPHDPLRVHQILPVGQCVPEHVIALYDNVAPEGHIPHLEAALQ